MRATKAMPAGVAAAALLALSACAGPSHGSTAADEAPAPQVQPSGPNDVDIAVPAPAPSPTWDPQSRAAALSAASSVMTAFTDHRADATAWWADLEPALSAQAAADYAGTDPAAVPARAVTGPATLLDDTSAYLATVEVPTDAGTYEVLLFRTGAGAPWLVERLTPPAALAGQG